MSKAELQDMGSILVLDGFTLTLENSFDVCGLEPSKDGGHPCSIIYIMDAFIINKYNYLFIKLRCCLFC